VRETKKVHEIDKTSYEIWHLPPRKALKVLATVIQVVGEPMGTLAAQAAPDGKSVLDQELNPEIIGRAIKAFAEKLHQVDVADTVEEVLSYVYIKGAKGGFIQSDMDRDFTGKIGHMLRVFAKALEVNFSDFFGESGGFVGIVRRLDGSQSRTSTGESGE
jgi:hypothetical protein